MVFCSPCPSKHRNPEAGGGGSCIWVQNFDDIDNLILFDVRLGCAVRSFLLPPSTSKRLCFSSILKDFVKKKISIFPKQVSLSTLRSTTMSGNLPLSGAGQQPQAWTTSRYRDIKSQEASAS